MASVRCSPRPVVFWAIVGQRAFFGQKEPHEFVVLLNEFQGCIFAVELLGKMGDFFIKHIRQSFEEHQRQDVVLVLGCIQAAPE